MSDDALREETVASERVFEGRLLSVRVDRVRLADGVEAAREVVEHPGAVGVLPLCDDGRVVLIRQFRQPTGEVLWEIPAGTLKAGESPQDCARRELAEEIGYAPGVLRFLAEVYVSPGYSSEMIHLFAARDLRPVERQSDHDERIRAVVVDFDHALAMIRSGDLRDAKTVCALLLSERGIAARGLGAD